MFLICSSLFLLYKLRSICSWQRWMEWWTIKVLWPHCLRGGVKQKRLAWLFWKGMEGGEKPGFFLPSTERTPQSWQWAMKVHLGLSPMCTNVDSNLEQRSVLGKASPPGSWSRSPPAPRTHSALSLSHDPPSPPPAQRKACSDRAPSPTPPRSTQGCLLTSHCHCLHLQHRKTEIKRNVGKTILARPLKHIQMHTHTNIYSESGGNSVRVWWGWTRQKSHNCTKKDKRKV